MANDNTKKITITFPGDVWFAIQKYCQDYEVSLSTAVRRLVEDKLIDERYLH
jgi:macrodomain Ter protein organizer (MatP/YcbG family)